MRKTCWIWKAPHREFSWIPDCGKRPDVKHPKARPEHESSHEQQRALKALLAYLVGKSWLCVSYGITKEKCCFFSAQPFYLPQRPFQMEVMLPAKRNRGP